jgi:hypothetical protein
MQDLQNRSISLLNADTVFDGAKDLLRVVEKSTPLPQTWLDLATEFERAARLYRQAGLGLMAKQSFERARHAYEASGDDAAAARCYARSQAIPVLWEAHDA